MDGYGDDSLTPLFPRSHQPSFDFFSQSESSFDRDPRTGLQALDLNSRAAEEFPNMPVYSAVLHGGSEDGVGEDGGAAAQVERGGGGGRVGGTRTLGLRAPRKTTRQVDRAPRKGNRGGGSTKSMGAGASAGGGSVAVGVVGRRGARRGGGGSSAGGFGCPTAGAGGSASAGGGATGGGAGGSGAGWQEDPIDLDGEEAADEVSMQNFPDGSSSSSSDSSLPSMLEFSSDSSSSSDGVLEEMRNNSRKRARDMMMLGSYFGMYHDLYMHKASRRTPTVPGLQWVQETVANSKECFNMFRMATPLFHRLHDLLVDSYGLRSTRMFLWMVGAPQSIRQVENRFMRSKETISRTFDRQTIKPVDPEFKTVHPRLQPCRFAPFFNNCIAAIHGTHVPVIVPRRHGYTSQNVLAICDFDMKFIFVLTGWPGSVHDMRVFNCAISKYGDKFPHPPPGKFYLVDSGYPNRPGYLAPYKGTKYHLPEFQNGPAPRGIKETFNYAHSSLRNVIERTFGVLKVKWRILGALPSYPMPKQSKIISACIEMHNFIRESALADKDLDTFDRNDHVVPMDIDSRTSQVQGDEDNNMNAFRDEIARELLYLEIGQKHGQGMGGHAGRESGSDLAGKGARRRRAWAHREGKSR
ncbi:hypothetical protein U9M48_016110, partial [Paspalum notatum var. saurae]